MTYKRTKRRYLFAALALLTAAMLGLSARGWMHSHGKAPGTGPLVRIADCELVIGSTQGQLRIDIFDPGLGLKNPVGVSHGSWPRWGFGMRRGFVPGPPATWVYMAAVPYWFLTSLFAIFMILSLSRLVRYRTIANACAKCGYDLRGSVGRSECPDCGETIAATATDPPATGQ